MSSDTAIKGYREALRLATKELENLKKGLESQKIDSKDIRFGFFSQMQDIIDEIIKVKMEMNSQQETIFSLNNQNIKVTQQLKAL